MPSSSAILCSAPDSLASSPRLLGDQANPTIGVGNFNGGRTRSPSDRPVCSSSTLATATIWPAEAESMAVRFAPLHGQQLMQLDRLADARDVHVVVLLERAGKQPQEAQLVHERIDAGFEDLGHQRAGRITT